MTYQREILIGLICLIVGTIGGINLNKKEDPAIKQLRSKTQQLEQIILEKDKDYSLLQKSLEEVQNQNTSYLTQLNTLEQNIGTDYSQVEFYEEPLTYEEPIATTETPSATQEQRQRERRGNPFENMSEEQRAQWEQQRQEARIAMEQRMTEIFNRELVKYDDPAWQARVLEIQTYQTNTRELFQQIQNAQTNEERDAIRQQIEESSAYIRDLQNEQRNYEIRNLATKYGITNPQQQEEFITNIQETLGDSTFGRGGPRGFGGRGPGPGMIEGFGRGSRGER